jgi:hypothetical protein
MVNDKNTFVISLLALLTAQQQSTPQDTAHAVR